MKWAISKHVSESFSASVHTTPCHLTRVLDWPCQLMSAAHKTMEFVTRMQISDSLGLKISIDISFILID